MSQNVYVLNSNLFSTPGALKATDVLARVGPGDLSVSCITGFNTAAGTDYFIQVYDALTIPANGAFDAGTRKLLFQVPAYAGLPWTIEFLKGWRIANGIFVCKSTTSAQLTAQATADQVINISGYQL